METDNRDCIEHMMSEYGFNEVCREASEAKSDMAEAEMKAALFVAANEYIAQNRATYEMYADIIHIYERLIEYTGGKS